MTSEKTLVVAFDGMDYGLIKKWDLDCVQQEEFGRIDNSTDMSKVMTSELFASFITGLNHTNHGIKGLKVYDNKKRGEIYDYFQETRFESSLRGYNFLLRVLWAAFDLKEYKPTKSDLNPECTSLFDEIEHSRAMFIPSYNPSNFWTSDADWEPLKLGYDLSRAARGYDGREFNYRKKELFREIESDYISPRNFLMCHFHRLDTYQHFYGDKDIGTYNLSKLKPIYDEMDELASKIKEKALSSGYDTVIFISDHGLPEGEEHNKNAFYSSNNSLFPDKKPHITDFFDQIKERV